jgi:predicted nucleic acid-binding protein
MNIAELDAAIGDAHRAFVDSSTCIANFSTAEHVHALARHVFERIGSNTDPLTGYISTVSCMEMLVRPIRSAGPDLETVTGFLREYPNLHLLDIDLHVALQAANIRALTRMAPADALLVGTAIMAACEVIISNDERWARRLAPLYPRFRWVYLGD